MKDKSGKFDLRLRMVHHAIRYGNKPAARRFTTTARIVRKWLRRYRQELLAGLVDLPKIPHNCPHKTPLQIISETDDKIDPAVAKLPPLMLDRLGPDYITKEELS